LTIGKNGFDFGRESQNERKVHMKETRSLGALVLSLMLCQSALAVDYGQLMATKVRAAIGRKANGYTFATYPVDNYGLATAYEDKVNPEKELCATWDCLGVSDDTKVEALTPEEKLKLRIGAVQYAETGDGPALNLTDDEKRSIALKAIFLNSRRDSCCCCCCRDIRFYLA
jgi:hypothetical protein